MTPPPLLTPHQPPLPTRPPPLPTQRHKIPTVIYFLLFILFLIVDVVLAYQTANVRVPGNLAFAIGMVQGGVLLPMGLAAGIACIWRTNRGFRGIVRVLFWASLVVLLTKLSQLANPTRPRPDTALEPTRVGTQPNLTDSSALSGEDKAVLLKQAEIIQAAVNESDFDTVMKHTSPALIKLIGKDAFEQAGREAMAQNKAKGIKYIKTDFGEPTTTYQTGKEVVCFVPRTSLLQVRGKQIKSQAYWVAIRTNGDSDWKFLDGAGFQNNKGLLWKIFPGLPGNVQFPEWRQEVLN
jgi:hypothetical protein